MIIGLSHISVNTTSIVKKKEEYLRNQWHLLFAEHNLLNSPSKKEFLNEYNDKHHICVLTKEANNDIEIVEHGKKRFKGNNIYFLENNTININCNSFENSYKFWTKGMGFSKNGDIYNKFSPFLKWNCRIKLIPFKGNTNCFLDGDGVSCLAFFSTDLNKDTSLLLQGENYCTKHSGNFNLTVNGKNLMINIVRGPSGELVELIQLNN